jgi:alginate O-acetyltransferase complex protein AlgI
MVFSNLTFVCLFLPVVLAFYHGAPHSVRNLVLVGASIVFYLWGGKAAIILVLASIAANFALGQAIAAADADRRTRLIRWSVAGNLFVLILFKYTNFVIGNVNVVLEAMWGRTLPNPHVPLPLGISFITFHILSYLIDVYRGVAEPQRSPVPFALYILNFPQLVAGPIIRYRPMAPQLARRPISFEDIDIGIMRFAAGLGKKLLIANPIGAVADQLFAIEPAGLPTWALWLAVVCYTLQIYFDFSGYSDMAIGIARMFGFRFPENFNYPYRATSIQDFWRRWHITLSAWFRDYVYVPLGGNRGPMWRTTLNLWIVFLLCGAWHGASWNFIVWGLWHGLFLSIERVEVVQRSLARLPEFVRIGYVLLIVLVGWVFFRQPSLDLAFDMLWRMFVPTGSPDATLFVSGQVPPQIMLLVAVAIVFAYPVWPVIKQRLAAAQQGPGSQVAYDVTRAMFIGGVTILCVATMALDQHNPFIYFRF